MLYIYPSFSATFRDTAINTAKPDQRDELIERLSREAHTHSQRCIQLEGSNRRLASTAQELALQVHELRRDYAQAHEVIGELRKLTGTDVSKLTDEVERLKRCVDEEQRGRLRIESALCEALGSWAGSFLDAAIQRIKQVPALEELVAKPRDELVQRCVRRALDTVEAEQAVEP